MALENGLPTQAPFRMFNADSPHLMANRVVQSIADRDSIAGVELVDGRPCFVIDTWKDYRWNGSAWIQEASIVYDGQDTAANIKAMNPTDHLGERWWAIDEKIVYGAFSSVTQAADVWQGLGLLYDEATDTFKLSDTQDGQTQNLGQEQFVKGFNDNGTGATALNPKVFMVTGVKAGEENIKTVNKAIAADLSSGQDFGLNTVEAAVNGYTKIVVWGDINDVNTSAWTEGTQLYLDTVTPGELTDVKPSANAWAIARVLISHATAGKLRVNTIAADQDSVIIPGAIDRQYLTGDQTDGSDPAGLNNFYLALREDKGSVASVFESAVVPDNSTVGIGKDHLGIQVPIPVTIKAGSYRGQIEFDVNITGGNERIYVEVYKANADGTVVDAGTGLPNGDLGVPPIVVGVSPLMDSGSGVPIFTEVTGTLTGDVNLAVGERVRYHILCEKVGTAGGNKTFNVYYGSDHLSFFESPVQIFLDDIADVEITNPEPGDVLVLGNDGIWRNEVGAGVIVGGEWRFSNSIVASDPGAGFLRFNNATPASITELYISSTTNPGKDVQVFLDALASGDSILVQDESDSNVSTLFNVVSAVDNTGWFTITVTVKSTGGVLPSNNTRLGVVIQYGGAGGGGGGSSELEKEIVFDSNLDTVRNAGFRGAIDMISFFGFNDQLNLSGFNMDARKEGGSWATISTGVNETGLANNLQNWIDVTAAITSTDNWEFRLSVTYDSGITEESRVIMKYTPV